MSERLIIPVVPPVAELSTIVPSVVGITGVAVTFSTG